MVANSELMAWVLVNPSETDRKAGKRFPARTSYAISTLDRRFDHALNMNSPYVQFSPWTGVRSARWAGWLGKRATPLGFCGVRLYLLSRCEFFRLSAAKTPRPIVTVRR